jgi:hypothetical protein
MNLRKENKMATIFLNFALSILCIIHFAVKRFLMVFLLLITLKIVSRVKNSF